MGRDASLAKRAFRFRGRKMRVVTLNKRVPTFQLAEVERKSL